MGIYTHRENYAANKSREEESGEAVLYGEACGPCTRSHSQLVVDRVEVPVDSAGAKEESFGD